MNAQILLSYYMGSYGPTIRIDTHLPEQLLFIRDLFGRLASDGAMEEDFACAVPCRLDSIRTLLVRSTPRRLPKALELERRDSGGASFRWSNTPEDWLECAAKVGALIDSGAAGHQYLTTETIDDALVELSYQE
jgi:hypothetical protein